MDRRWWRWRKAYPEYVLSHNANRVVIRNFEGKVFEYPEAADGTPLMRAPRRIEEPELV
jgi:hypothetical protein